MQEQTPKQTILAVDDTPENLDVIKGILTPDLTVKVAINGEAALKVAKMQKPDLILLDIMMPGMDGYEVCRQLKMDETTRDIPVIFVTAKDQTEDEAHGLELGAVDYITKPINHSILKARVQTHLDLYAAKKTLLDQNKELIEAAHLRDDVEMITRHDLKAPLNTIIGVPELLLMVCDFTDDQRDIVKGMEDAGYRMLNMINRSLDLYKMENGTYEFQPEPLDILDILKKVDGEHAAQARSKTLRCRILIDGRSPVEDERIGVMGEGLLCHSLFSNLFKNAVEASPEGEDVLIRVDTSTKVRITIENMGEVPESIRETFFDKCVTADKQGGTGLGTYSAKLITETQKGSIDLDTSVSGVTRIHVELSPCAKETLPSRYSAQRGEL